DPDMAVSSANANYRQLARHLASSVVGQSEFQDWSVAEGFNDQIQLLNERAVELQALFLTGALTPAMTTPVSDVLLKAFFADNKQTTAASIANLAAARMRLRQQYETEYAQLNAQAGL